VPRSFQPDDLYRLRVPTDPRLSPDGSSALITLQTTAPLRDGYRHAVWLVPLDGGEARQLTLGAKHDRHARYSPDGRTVAFLSDRRLQIEEEPDAPSDPKDREDAVQVHLLPLDGGEARRLTDLPRGVDAFWWSPDGTRMIVATSSVGATREEDRRRRGKRGRPGPGEPPESDYRYVDRVGYLLNGPGFVYDRIIHLWIVDVATGAARRLTEGRVREEGGSWSPDGRRFAFAANPRRDDDLATRTDLVAVDVDSGRRTLISGGRDGIFREPVWLPDGRAIAALGGRVPANAYRTDIWLFAADGSDGGPDGGRNLSGRHDLMPASSMNSDIVPHEAGRLVPSADGRWLTFTAPVEGAYELHRISISNGRVERLTHGRHYVSAFDQGRLRGGGRGGGRGSGRATARIVFLQASPTELSDVHVLDLPETKPRRVTSFNAEALDEITLRTPVERRFRVDGREIQGWLLPAGPGRRPTVTEIHGGPHTLYGWSPSLEFQVLAASGISVFYCNPRGSEGYGRDFNEANLSDWGPGPTRDVLGGIDGLVDDGLADPGRLGLTGGSYGGYLTNWILAHDGRFAAAITCRSVSDLQTLFLTGDIGGHEWPRYEFGGMPWERADVMREQSPITYAHRIRTPLLIQHSERDIRTTVGQAEALFSVLRAHRRPVRLMRVPEENHELTRSGTPFRRAENLVQVRDWFRHFLVDGKRRLPPLPRARAGK
jgi:dipeptidyl aminopeptidase/acylaminoacyl peptidase